MFTFLLSLLSGLLMVATPFTVDPDTTNSADQPTLRECGLMMPPLQEAYQQAFSMEESPERQAIMREVAETIRDVQACYGERRKRVVMSTYRALVTAKYEAGNPEASLRVFDEFFERYTPSDDSTFVSWMHSARGRYQYLLGHAGRAVSDYARAVTLTPEGALDVRIQRMNNLALTYNNLQEWEAALHYFQQVEQRASQVTPASELVQLEKGRALAARAGTLISMAEQGKVSIDEHLLRIETDANRAFELLESVDHDLSIGPLLSLSTAYLLAGQLDDAEAALQKAHARITPATSPNRRLMFLRVQGQLALQRGALNEARHYFAEAHTMATTHNLLAGQQWASVYNGQIAERTGALDAAHSHYQAAMTLAESGNESIRATLWSSRSLSVRRGGYEGMMRTLRQQGKADEAFDIWSRSRGRFLHDTRMQAALLNEMSADVRMQFNNLTTELNIIRTQRADATLSDEERTTLMQEEAILTTKRNALVELAPYSTETVRPQLQHWLEVTGRTLIAYQIDTGNALAPVDPAVTAYVVRPDTVVAVPIDHTPGTLKQLAKRISPLLVDDQVSVSINTSAFDLHALHEAYETLIAPLASYLPETGGLVVAPDGVLFQVPFGALVTAPPASSFSYDTAEYLIEERAVLSTLSPTLLIESPPDGEGPMLDVAAFGVSNFGGTSPSDNLLASEVRLRSNTDSLALVALPGVSTELHHLKKMFARTHVALNEDATPQAVRDHSARATVVHLASHALLSPTDPLGSAFVLSEEGSNDGLLRVHDIMRPGSAVPLVVLSGCSTARGELRSGEGLLGLQYAFQASGAQSTLSHLWPTDDDTAVALSTLFYEHLRDGHPKDVALQRAQLAFMDAHPERRAPFFWASPVLFGNPDALSFSAPASSWFFSSWIRWSLIVVAAIGLIGILLRIRYRVTHA